MTSTSNPPPRTSRPHVIPSRSALALLVATLVAAPGATGCKSPTASYGSTGGGGANNGGGSGPLHLGPFAIGQSETFTFANAGTFGYHCIPHRSMGMTGSVTVDASGADSVVVQIGANGLLAFAPPAAHIKPSGHVRWVNMSNLTIHTVTSD